MFFLFNAAVNTIDIYVKLDEVQDAMFEGLDELVKLLEKLSKDKSETNYARTDSENFLQSILSFNFIVVLFYFWHYFPGKIECVQKRLKDPTMNFKDATLDIESLEMKFVQRCY